jgi:hypothetical protein
MPHIRVIIHEDHKNAYRNSVSRLRTTNGGGSLRNCPTKNITEKIAPVHLYQDTKQTV